MQMIGELSSVQEEALVRAQANLGKTTTSGFGLGRWLQDDDSRTRLVDLLTSLMGESRLARAMGIPDGDVNVAVATPQRVEAKIRTYNLTMDRSSKIIDHDCGDWERAVDTRQLCKHIGRVLLTIPAEIGIEWADAIFEDVEKWKFRVPGKTR